MHPLGKKRKKKSKEELLAQFMRLAEKQSRIAFEMPVPLYRKFLK